MNATFRLLIPDKKGIQKRIEAAVKVEGGRVKSTRLKRQMRGMIEAEVDIVIENDLLQTPIHAAMGRIPGVVLLGARFLIPPSLPPVQR